MEPTIFYQPEKTRHKIKNKHSSLFFQTIGARRKPTTLTRIMTPSEVRYACALFDGTTVLVWGN
jgi:hypothetical protein